jgi:phosphocarrier protein FPr
LEQRRHAWQSAHQAARVSRHHLAATRDGRRVRVLANLNNVADVTPALDAGAEGVGVLRTEFLFTNRRQPPTEAEQLVAYQTIADALGARPLVIRTLDAGGDKPLAYVDMAGEPNPFLGWRGLRVSLGRPDLLKTQLRAILRASPGHHIEIMFPMVSVPSEVREAKAILREAQSELRQAGIAFDETIRVGIMIEVPAAVAVADQLAREASFFSIGSNDLSQYVMAADRTNPRVASIADHYQPAVLRMIQQTVHAARQAGIEVGLCGELGGDPLAMPVLIGLGLDELSMSAPAIPHVKQAIAGLTLPEAQAAAADVLSLDSGQAVRHYLVQQFAQA